MESLFPRLYRERVARVPFATVKPGVPFSYRGITYIKSMGTNEAYRLLRGQPRVMAPDINVRAIVGLKYGNQSGEFEKATR